MVKLWVDDIRDAPGADWIVARTVKEAQEILTTRVVHTLSLDHDLGMCSSCVRADAETCRHIQSGYDLVKWMVEGERWPIKKPAVHSMNPVGRQNMQALIDRWGPYV